MPLFQKHLALGGLAVRIVFNKPSTSTHCPWSPDSNGSHQGQEQGWSCRENKFKCSELDAISQTVLPHRDSKFIEASYVCTTRCHPSLEKKRVRQLNKNTSVLRSPSCSLLYQGASSWWRKACILFCNTAVRKETGVPLLAISKTLLNCYRNAVSLHLIWQWFTTLPASFITLSTCC